MAVENKIFYFQRVLNKLFCNAIFLIFFFISSQCPAQEESITDPFPEQSEMDEIYAGEEPEGIVFLVMEHDEEALYWVLPRVIRYTQQLHERWGDLPIAVLSHGDEMFALVEEFKSLNEKLHQSIIELSNNYDVVFQVCGSYASFSDVDSSEFPDYIDVVPSAPAEITNYRQMEYKFIALELIW